MTNEKEVFSAKEKLRREMRTRLRGMNSAWRAEASLTICHLAASLPAFLQARCVGMFAPLPSEPDIDPLIEEAAAQGKRVAFPLMVKHGTRPILNWHEVTGWDELAVPSPFGLREPDPSHCARLEPNELDCILVPGLAFDRTGVRLGRGGGYYDAALGVAPETTARVGIFFQSQELPHVPSQSHDQRLTIILTENGLRQVARR